MRAIYGKVKVFHIYAMKTYRERRGIDPLIPNAGIRWTWAVQHHTPAALPPSEKAEPVGPRASLDVLAKKKPAALAGIRTPRYAFPDPYGQQDKERKKDRKHQAKESFCAGEVIQFKCVCRRIFAASSRRALSHQNANPVVWMGWLPLRDEMPAVATAQYEPRSIQADKLACTLPRNSQVFRSLLQLP
jgi:hypothetical protein